MVAVTRQRPQEEATHNPAKIEDNTLDEQHAGLPELTFPVTDNDQSTDSGQSHVASDDREQRIAVAAYLRAERRGFVAGAELEDWLEADRDYMEQMVKDHQTIVELFETAADDAELHADLRAYAKKTLPTLRDHLKEAQTIESKLSD